MLILNWQMMVYSFFSNSRLLLFCTLVNISKKSDSLQLNLPKIGLIHRYSLSAMFPILYNAHSL